MAATGTFFSDWSISKNQDFLEITQSETRIACGGQVC
jgi:hypothetical protein